MKASVYTIYGPPDVQHLKEVEKPVPKDDEVLIKIHATTVNRTDCGFRKPEYIIVRLFNGLLKPRKTILGSELAGEIEAVGKDVRTFKPGDRVFGLSTSGFGAHAEYLCLKESGSITAMPVNMPFEEAAAICDGLMLAMTYMRKINFKKSRSILINGASGSIGSAGLQLARFFGAEKITAVCDTANMEWVKALGADEVIDYTQADFTRIGERYDVVFDAVGKSSFFRCRNLLKPRGIYFSTELGFLLQNVYLPLVTHIIGGKRMMFPIPTDCKADIVFFRELVEAGKYKAVIDRRYRLDQIVEASRYVETGRKAGNVVIAIR